MIFLGEEFPNFSIDTTIGMITFHEWVGKSWCLLMSFSKDFVEICNTELKEIADMLQELRKRNVKPLFISSDSMATHMQWIHNTIKSEFPIPMIADEDRHLSSRFGILDMSNKDALDCPYPSHAVFLMDPNNTLLYKQISPAFMKRNIIDIIKIIDQIQEQKGLM